MMLSLKVRQAVISLVLMLFLLPVCFLAIERAFFAQLLTSTEQKLEVHLYSFLSELTSKNDIVEINNSILPADFLRPDSGTSAFIVSGDKLMWQSDSSLNQTFIPPQHEMLPGKHEFISQEQDGRVYWTLSFALLFDMGERSMPLTIHIVQDEQLLDAPVKAFRNTLMRWFIGIAAVLMLVMLLAYYWTTQPLSALDHEIRQVESGEQQQLNGSYPAELTTLKEDVNLLLASQNRQKQRYRHHLSDLAHALKTPVAVLNTSPLAQQPELREQIDRITAMIEHQLKRASSSGQDVWQKQIAIPPIIGQLQSALQKIYRGKQVQLALDCPANAMFRGDETDLMEMLGNLLDNAFKACQQHVALTVTLRPLTISVEDDGPGVPPNKTTELLSRGTRLDTYKEGHGVGLSIVHELCLSYSGEIDIEQSPLGGACFRLRFPDHQY
ncbi:histidine kinase [Rheinheimera sp. SA_1]|jgi:two-component system sensor histidine kinase PhoQ|uniref:ATP-binding protein n=1 Tax=Rheinheimera sp. SA_1 TaxID=1827365 RepID=UPI0008022562|nr:ATP-binding protein [Rheinheimera sp. SA_1]OBP14594.1 histidine kinase [Rheinheimera sp. SA_1]